jgi:DNA-3-methyladenine glycosylase
MFEKPGRAYVYFIYGMYEMLNFVTEPEGTPGAVLIRAVEPVSGFGTRPPEPPSGPGRLTRLLGINRTLNRSPLDGPALKVFADAFRPGTILSSPRVGISDARHLRWRFFLKDNHWVSRVPENRLGRKT